MPIYKEGAFGQLLLQDIAGKNAIMIQDGKITLVTQGFVYFTSFMTDDLLEFAQRAKECQDFLSNVNQEEK